MPSTAYPGPGPYMPKPTLANALQPQQGAQQLIPKSLPDLLMSSPGRAQTPVAPETPQQTNKALWKARLSELWNDPLTAQTLIEVGAGITNASRQGYGAMGSITQGIAQGSRFQREERARQGQEERQGKMDRLQERRVDFEGKRLEQGEDELEEKRKGRLGREAYRDKELELRRQALVQGEKNSKAPTESDKLTAALVAEQGLSEPQARIKANEIAKGNTRADKIHKAAMKILETSFDINLTPEQATAQAAAMIDGVSEDKANDQIATHPGWEGIPQEKQMEMIRLVRSGKGTRQQLMEFLESRVGGE